MEDSTLQKVPFSAAAEKSVLGAILIDPESFTRVADFLKPEDFYLEVHQKIYECIIELFQKSKAIDAVTLADLLAQNQSIEQKEAEDILLRLADSVPGTRNIQDYARIVKDHSIRRNLISASQEIAARSMNADTEITRLVDYAEMQIYNVSQGRDTKNFRRMAEIIQDVYEELHTLYDNPDSAGEHRVNTGFGGLDSVLSGVNDTDLVLIGARPGMGKTSFALNIATNVAKTTEKAVCIFSLEMSAEQLVSRVLSSEAMVDSKAMRTGRLSNNDWSNLAEAVSELYKTNILIDDTSSQTVTSMKSKLRRLGAGKIGLVVIDYLQLMQGESHTDNRVQEVAEISRGLKIMAKDLGVPVICCAQLSRGPEGREDKKPKLSDLRDSGAIEQDADTVLFLYRPEYYKNEKVEEQTQNSICEVIVAKNRHGMTGTVEMGWVGRFTKFVSLAKNENLPEPPPEPGSK
ncbi:MAG: replicative DNA helicase [Clostridia bacterium]|nr:replicative DNA helicase [Clostridia bacterium]